MVDCSGTQIKVLQNVATINKRLDPDVAYFVATTDVQIPKHEVE